MYFKKSLKLNLNEIIYSWVGREWEKNVNRELINFQTWLNYTQQNSGWKVNKFLSNTRISFFASNKKRKIPMKNFIFHPLLTWCFLMKWYNVDWYQRVVKRVKLIQKITSRQKLFHLMFFQLSWFFKFILIDSLKHDFLIHSFINSSSSISRRALRLFPGCCRWKFFIYRFSFKKFHLKSAVKKVWHVACRAYVARERDFFSSTCSLSLTSAHLDVLCKNFLFMCCKKIHFSSLTIIFSHKLTKVVTQPTATENKRKNTFGGLGLFAYWTNGKFLSLSMILSPIST